MKTDTIYKKTFNAALDMLARIEPGAALPTENLLAGQLETSRTTVRKVLAAFTASGLISNGVPRIKLR